MIFRVTIKRVEYLEAEIEAEDLEDARDMAQDRSLDWREMTAGRGLGDDDAEVLDIEQLADEYDDEEEGHQ